MIIMKRLGVLAGWIAVIVLTASCSLSPRVQAPAPAPPTVAVSFYAAQFLASQIGQDAIEVVNVVPSGSEPHDLELSLQDVLFMDTADVAFFVHGFQPAMDVAATEVDLIDLAPDLALIDRNGTIDPHFWLDPNRMVMAAESIAAHLGEALPEHEELFAANLDRLRTDLHRLDQEYSTQLTNCQLDTFFTSHEAFGYLAQTYGLHEWSVAGIDPETEPAPVVVDKARKTIHDLGVPVVFAEPGHDKTAQVLATDAGVELAVLDPVELTPDSGDYITVMQSNLKALKGGLMCP